MSSVPLLTAGMLPITGASTSLADVPRLLADDTFRLRVAASADVDHVVTALDEVLDKIMRDDDVGAGRVHHVETAFGSLRLYRRRDAMRGEDHGAAVDRLQALEPVVTIDQLDAVFLQLVGDVGVVDEIAEHPDLLARMGLRGLLGGTNRLNDAVAISTRRDLEDVHASSLPAGQTGEAIER